MSSLGGRPRMIAMASSRMRMSPTFRQPVCPDLSLWQTSEAVPVVADLQRVIDLHHRNGLIPRPVEASSLFDASFNAAASAGAAEAAR